MPTICPVALAVGCRKCPIFSVCPVKSVIGDYKPPKADHEPAPAAKAAAPPKRKAPAKRSGAKRPVRSTRRK